MERIIKAIEEKMESYENEIYWLKHENNELKRKLDEADNTITALAKQLDISGGKTV